MDGWMDKYIYIYRSILLISRIYSSIRPIFFSPVVWPTLNRFFLYSTKTLSYPIQFISSLTLLDHPYLFLVCIYYIVWGMILSIAIIYPYITIIIIRDSFSIS